MEPSEEPELRTSRFLANTLDLLLKSVGNTNASDVFGVIVDELSGETTTIHKLLEESS